MSICKAMAGPENVILKTFFIIIALGLMMPAYVSACSCIWKGPFLTAAQDAPLVIIGKILRHHPGKSPAMDVLVLETLKGGLLDSGMTIQMGDGMHCRPPLDVFPVGTQWILALNGQGAKPGGGWAISHCGEYWLKVEGDYVVGSLDGDMKQVKKMPMNEFKNRFLYPNFIEKYSGRVEAGKTFRRAFGSRFEFILDPMAEGWQIVIKEVGRDENLARLTPPLHFKLNPREIEGWHFLKNPAACANRPYNAAAGPANPREFIFSPEVGKTVDGENAGRSVTENDMKSVQKFGRGMMKIEKIKLMPGKDGCPKIEWLDFIVNLEGGIK